MLVVPLEQRRNNIVHNNGIDYNPDLDQIVLSSRKYNEIWIIDHSTTTAEAAGHTGGNSGMGGDILYRWGNPDAYDRGDASNRALYGQHDPQWIKPGLPGEGNIILFNNGYNRPLDKYSTIDEIVAPENGFNYTLDPAPGAVYGPAASTWSYAADPPSDFYSWFISGVTRLPNGNTLIDEENKSRIFEVDTDGTVVWEYSSPVLDGPAYITQGDTVEITQAAPSEIWANRLFRAPRYAPDYPAFDGRDLTPGAPLELYTASADWTLQSTAGGTVTIGEGTYSYGVGQLVTIVAVPDPLSRFVSWSVVSGSATFADPNSEHTTFTMGSAATIVANFEPVPVPALSLLGRLLLAALLIGIASLMVRRPAALQA